MPPKISSISFFLLASLSHHSCAYKRRISHDVVVMVRASVNVRRDSGKKSVIWHSQHNWHSVFVSRLKCRPVHEESVSLNDERVCCERKKVNLLPHDFLGLVNHLAFGNPKRGFCDRYGKIVYLDSEELADFYVDELVESEHALAFVQERNHFVFKSSEREECLRKKVSASASRVKKRERAELFLERNQLFFLGF